MLNKRLSLFWVFWRCLHLVGLLLFIFSSSYAQDYLYRQYTVEDGLPSNQVYAIRQDCNGYLWLATENGLSQYDGETFTNYTVDDGLPDTEIIGFFEDSKNRLWFCTLNGKLGFYENGGFYNAENTPFLREAFLNDYIMNAGEDSKGNIYFSSRNTLIHIDAVDRLKHFSLGTIGTGMPEDTLGIRYLIPDLNPVDTILALPSLKKHPFDIGRFDTENQYDFIHKSIKTFAEIHQLDERNRKLIEHSQNHHVLKQEDKYWVSAPNRPLMIFQEQKEKLDLIYSIDNLFTTRMLEDHEKNIWIGSLGKGVYKFKNAASKVYKIGRHLKGELLTSLFIDKKTKEIYCGTSDGILNVISEDTIKTNEVERFNRGLPRIRDIHKDGFGNLWLICDSQVDIINAKTLKNDNNFVINSKYGPPKSVVINNEKGIAFLATGTSTSKLYFDENKVKGVDVKLKKRSTAVHLDGQQNLWIGTSKGLYIASNLAVDSVYTNVGIDDQISCLNHLGSTLIAGSKGRGLVLVNGDSIRRLSKKTGLPSNLIRSISVRNKVVWVSTDQGLCKINNVNSPTPSYTTITEQNGLISNDVVDCDIIDSTLYVLCAQGLCILTLSSIQSGFIPPKIKIDQALANNELLNIDTINRLAPSQNNISISFSGIHFSNRKQLNYQYKLNGFHKTWHKTNNNNLVFEKLPPGEYDLEVYAEINGIKSSQPEHFNFRIKPAFYQRFLVKILAIVFFCLALFYFIRYLLNREILKSKTEKRLIQLEQLALQSQMNPHFIKNSLGAIQHLMIKKDVRAANKYLTVFGELITQLLQQSDQSTIKVIDEIEILELYLSIEKLRFDNNFEYQIKCETKEILDKKIPSMMIQPLVENSIIHGFRELNKNQKNRVDILLEAKKDYVICSVQDNGSGIRNTLNQNKSSLKRKGIAMNNIKERISLLSVKYPKANFAIVDAYKDGTLIKLNLPLIEDYD